MEPWNKRDVLTDLMSSMRCKFKVQNNGLMIGYMIMYTNVICIYIYIHTYVCSIHKVYDNI